MDYYIQRDSGGAICGLYANPQPQGDGSCLTLPDPLPDDHPEVAAFLSRTPGGNGVAAAISKIMSDPTLVKQIADAVSSPQPATPSIPA